MEVDRRGRLGLNKKVIGAGRCEIVKIPFGLDDHQVHVERLFGGPAYRIHDCGAEGDVRHEPAIHDVDMDPVGAGPIDRADFFTEPPQIGRQNGGRDDDRLHRASAWEEGARRRINVSIAFAKPSSSWEAVTTSACACTSRLAFPIAMPRPLLRNISTSFGMSPIVAIWLTGTDSSFESVVTTVPLSAAG